MTFNLTKRRLLTCKGFKNIKIWGFNVLKTASKANVLAWKKKLSYLGGSVLI